MADAKTFLRALRERLMYLVAVLLILLIPLLFISFGSGLIEKVAKKIPLREGNFSGAGGVLKAERPSAPR
jgi:hypothetical protein